MNSPRIETREVPPRTTFALEQGGVHPLLDKAALKAVQALPPYSSPAKNGGVPVPFQMVLPVRFKPE